MRHHALINEVSAAARDALSLRRTPWICHSCANRTTTRNHRLSQPRRTIAHHSKLAVAPGLTGLEESRRSKSHITKSQIDRRIPQKLTTTEKSVLQRLDVFLNDAQESHLQTEHIPGTTKVLGFLALCREIGQFFQDVKDKPALATIRPESQKAIHILFPDEPGRSPVETGNTAAAIADQAFDKISDAVNAVAENENIMLGPDILRRVVETLALIDRPESLARVFMLFAAKDIPQLKGNQVKYHSTNPNAIGAAVPLEVAETALGAAIRVQNLPLCLDIIDQTVCTKAYKRAKIAKKAIVPAAAVGLVPAGAYVIASQLAEMQNAMSTSSMTLVGTLGITTYLAATGTIGFVAMATANDQMQRVTWASGMHLRYRWLREEERAFLDKVACAWGFQDINRRGEEEGQDWDALKELCGIRGMVLDRVELMEGMQ